MAILRTASGEILPAGTAVLRGDRCCCTACGEFFNSARAFDEHRTGAFEPITRRCFLPAEMLERGMRRNDTGFWLTRASAVPYSLAARRSGDRFENDLREGAVP